MRRNKLIKKIVTLFFSVALLASCDYDDVNQDPTRPGGDNVPLVAIVPAMQTQTHRNLTAVLGRFAGIIMQQWEGTDAQQLQYTSYVIGENDANNPWNFGLYTGSMRDAADIIDRATLTNSPNTRGLAKIYMAINLGLATNVWGDVPYSEAFLGEENLAPKYDSQEAIYNEIQNLLSEAIVDLQAEDPAGIQGSLVAGNAASWVKTAHGLKARFFIQTTSVKSDAAANALVQAQLAMASNAEQKTFFFEDTQNGGHPLALFGLQRPNTMVIGNFFANIMDGDPRKPLYMAEATGGNFLYFSSTNPNLVWSKLNSPSPVLSYSEVKFIEAEALERTGGDGTDALKAAIRANMAFLGVSAANIDAYISTVGDATIELIITEKYKALYGQSPIQVWNDFRRTGIPNITPNVNGSNGNNPSGIVPRRLLYPIAERQSNPDSYEAAIQAQGGHLQDDDIWVFPRD
ncbi:MAG: SusD/RagB family nutrient-binding outer membrane lipoprotein [Gillisia sp.]